MTLNLKWMVYLEKNSKCPVCLIIKKPTQKTTNQWGLFGPSETVLVEFSSWASSSLSSNAIFSLIFVQSIVRFWVKCTFWVMNVFGTSVIYNQLLNLNLKWLTKTLFKSINTFTLTEGTLPLHISTMIRVNSVNF